MNQRLLTEAQRVFDLTGISDWIDHRRDHVVDDVGLFWTSNDPAANHEKLRGVDRGVLWDVKEGSHRTQYHVSVEYRANGDLVFMMRGEELPIEPNPQGIVRCTDVEYKRLICEQWEREPSLALAVWEQAIADPMVTVYQE